jgi:hypothetical protein
MAMKDLTAFENRLYQYILSNDYESRPWVTMKVAKELGTTEEEVYRALSELTKKIKDNVWIFYKNGALHVVAE